ncbi:hypothetical protein BKA81DRAFT_121919 [Phyllosticta paracitricarpa]
MSEVVVGVYALYIQTSLQGSRQRGVCVSVCVCVDEWLSSKCGVRFWFVVRGDKQAQPEKRACGGVRADDREQARQGRPSDHRPSARPAARPSAGLSSVQRSGYLGITNGGGKLFIRQGVGACGQATHAHTQASRSSGRTKRKVRKDVAKRKRKE